MQTCLDQNRKTAYELIASHGDVENLIFFAMLVQGKLIESLCSFLSNECLIPAENNLTVFPPRKSPYKPKFSKFL